MKKKKIVENVEKIVEEAKIINLPE